MCETQVSASKTLATSSCEPGKGYATRISKSAVKDDIEASSEVDAASLHNAISKKTVRCYDPRSRRQFCSLGCAVWFISFIWNEMGYQRRHKSAIFQERTERVFDKRPGFLIGVGININ